jgi:hypothetical protein
MVKIWINFVNVCIMLINKTILLDIIKNAICFTLRSSFEIGT